MKRARRGRDRRPPRPGTRVPPPGNAAAGGAAERDRALAGRRGGRGAGPRATGPAASGNLPIAPSSEGDAGRPSPADRPEPPTGQPPSDGDRPAISEAGTGRDWDGQNSGSGAPG